MSKNLNKKSDKPKISHINQPSIVSLCHNERQNVLVSFDSVTDSKVYNFEYFSQNIRNELYARKCLDELLLEVSINTWTSLGLRDRKTLGGYESLPACCIKDSIKQKVFLSPDSKIMSFIFGQKNYRLLGVKPTACGALHVIGYDFDFSAYDHGS